MTCGYVCPVCEGSGMLEDGSDCDYCTEKPMIKRQERIAWQQSLHENYHVLLWLIKDSFWMMGFKLAGTIMVLPTISLSIYIAYNSRKNRISFIPNMAVCCWISANSCWMLQEFYHPSFRLPALISFLLGIALMVFYFIRMKVNK